MQRSSFRSTFRVTFIQSSLLFNGYRGSSLRVATGLGMSGTIPLLSPVYLHGVNGDYFTFIFYRIGDCGNRPIQWSVCMSWGGIGLLWGHLEVRSSVGSPWGQVFCGVTLRSGLLRAHLEVRSSAGSPWGQVFCVVTWGQVFCGVTLRPGLLWIYLEIRPVRSSIG
jgi:hypothetical protein